ncbi:5'-nucleotidase, lipoprotein e(P4) family [bacterium]|nr:5'-nucleotidase, lipoprotein e(P4) family [candidate division CSSED10-310 bacterium]
MNHVFKKFPIIISMLFIVSLINSCCPRNISNDYMLSAIAWKQTSAEARALSYQAFGIARYRFDEIKSEYNGSKPLAVIVDIDETVLDNTPFEAALILGDRSHPANLRQWTDKADAPAIPGALDFLNYVNSQGAEIFYLTNRSEKDKTATMKNLTIQNFPNVSETSVVMKTDQPDKTGRIQTIAEKCSIALIIGDSLGDFGGFYSRNLTIEQRAELVESKKDAFGAEYILLPNPMYGDWEKTIYRYQRNLQNSEKRKLLKSVLNAFSR